MRRILLSLLILTILAPVASGQATPVAIVFQLQDSFGFPQTLQVRVTVAIPAVQVARLALIIEPEGGTAVTINFPLQQPFEFAGEYTVARYTWTIPPDNLPALFGELRYTWRLVTTRDVVHEETRTILYQDGRTNWTTLESSGITMTYPASMQGVTPAVLRRQMDNVYQRLQQNTGLSPAFKWLIYPPELSPGCNYNDEGRPVVTVANLDGLAEEIPCDPALADQVYARSGYTVVTPSRNAPLQTLLLDSMISQFYTALWEGRNIPDWFRAGIQQVYSPAPKTIALITSRERLRSGSALSLAQMARRPETDPEGVWAAQSYGMVLYLMDKIGVGPVFELARTAGSAGTFAENYRTLTGMALETLIPDWQTWLFTTRADAVYSYSIYVPATLTPTMTFTPTITRTRLPPTETPTITPDYSPTPRPSRTPRPPTPTITPLPAESFSLRPTAVPATPVPAASSPIPGVNLSTQQIMVIAVVGVLALLLVVFGLFWRGR